MFLGEAHSNTEFEHLFGWGAGRGLAGLLGALDRQTRNLGNYAITLGNT